LLAVHGERPILVKQWLGVSMACKRMVSSCSQGVSVEWSFIDHRLSPLQGLLELALKLLQLILQYELAHRLFLISSCKGNGRLMIHVIISRLGDPIEFALSEVAHLIELFIISLHLSLVLELALGQPEYPEGITDHLLLNLLFGILVIGDLYCISLRFLVVIHIFAWYV